MAILTEAEVVRRVLHQERVVGTKALARQLGVSECSLINLRKGRKGVGPKLLAGLKLEVVYREMAR